MTPHDRPGRTSVEASRSRPAQRPSPLPTTNLFLDFAALAEALLAYLSPAGGEGALAELGGDNVFDAFLLVAGISQVLEDYLHRDVFSLGRMALHLPRMVGFRLGRLGAACAVSLRAIGLRVRAARPAERSVLRRARELDLLVELLAEATVGRSDEDPAGARREELERRAHALLADPTAFPPRLRRRIVRLPHCFRSFDQDLGDCERIVHDLMTRWPDRGRPLLVIGLRTAGSYLAPLYGALLRNEGYEKVRVATLRPGQPWLERDAKILAGAVREDALVLAVDEPPRTGTQLDRTARRLLRAGVDRDSLVLVTQLFGTGLPERLRTYQTVALGWPQWSIHERLAPASVQRTLAELLVGRELEPLSGEERSAPIIVEAVEGVERLKFTASVRGHAAAVFRVRLVDSAGERIERDIYVGGVGLGYLGRHVLAVAEALDEFVPRVYGVRDGLVYRAWLPEEWRLAPRVEGRERAAALGVASYVEARAERLAVPEDVSLRLVGEGAVWQQAAIMLAEAFGRAKLLVSPALQRIARALLAPRWAAVVDGSMGFGHWFAPPHARLPREMRKVDFSERAFSNEDMFSYDPVFDLAAAAADYAVSWAPDGTPGVFGEELRAAYDRLAPAHVSEEAWFLYQLLYHHVVERRRRERRAVERDEGTQIDVERILALERAMVGACQTYLGTRFFRDLEPPTEGPLCAIDVDWVLETRWLSVPTIGASGALALRALARHGYRPILVTGRSLSEVRARCRAFRLAGGAAEYGAVVYDYLSGRTRALLEPAEESLLAEIRARLAGVPGTAVDPAHAQSVRAYRLDAEGRRSGLEAETIAAILDSVGASEQVRAIVAPSQTDFAVARVGKDVGARALAEELRADGIALAVGDSDSDLPVLRLAARAYAPKNADVAVRRAAAAGEVDVKVMRRPFQVGLLQAVSSFLGHDPRRCERCRPSGGPNAPADVLLPVFRALEGGAREKVAAAIALATS